MTALTAPQFTDEAAAIAHLETSRWGVGATCSIQTKARLGIGATAFTALCLRAMPQTANP